MRNTGLEEAQAGIKISGRNINNLRYADDTTLMAESEEELKSLLMKVKEDSEKVGLKLNTEKTKSMASGPITSWQIDRETVETVADFTFLGSKITAGSDCSHEIKRRLLLGRKAMTYLSRQHIKKQRHYFANKGPSSQSYGFSSSHVWMWKLDYKESFIKSTEELMLLNCAIEEVSSESLGLQGDQTSQSQRNQSWVFIGRTDAEAETPILWPPDAKNWLIGKDSDTGEDWRQVEKGMTDDEMVGWHHWLNGLEFE